MTQWLERYRGILFFGLVVLIVAGVVLIQLVRPKPEPIILPTATLPVLQATTTPGLLRVYVSGAVQNPDVYEIPPGSIVKDAVLAAGGASEEADLDRINLAFPLADGQQIYVPREGESDPPVGSPSNSRGPDGKVSINTASLAELESLPGIGPSLAERIIAFREENGPFDAPEDIMEVAGIGEGIFDKIEDLITTK